MAKPNPSNARITVRPDPVPQGKMLLLRIDDGPSPEENDFEWIVFRYEDQSSLILENRGPKMSLNTTDWSPGIYDVRVTIQPKEGYSGDTINLESTFTIDPAPISPEFVKSAINQAVNLVDRMTSNAATGSQPPPAAQAKPVTRAGRKAQSSQAVNSLDDDQPLAVRVTMDRRFPEDRDSDNNLALWQTIRNRTEAVKFAQYQTFIDRVFQDKDRDIKMAKPRDFFGVNTFLLLQRATEAFLMSRAGVFIPDSTDNIPGEESRIGKPVTYDDVFGRLATYMGDNGLPYLDRIVRAMGNEPPDQRGGRGVHRDLDDFPDYLYDPHTTPRNILLFDDGFRSPLMLELIWNYWHEESMLVQTMNAISMRLQNRLGASDRDPLAHLELDPLRPLNNMLWGYVEEEYRRLTVQRRAYEYDHHYGLTLVGKAVPNMRTVDSRSKFLEAFHNLLTLCTAFYKQSDDTTVNPDPFPLLNALKEVHLILAQGAHNQFGDLPWTSRVEMLTQQWLLARPEMNEYLRGRPMVPYPEEWMGRVDTMRSLQNWGDASVTYFHNLAVFGEQILLSIRYTDWSGIDIPGPAGVWALYWRPEIQGYIHAYRAVTGVDLTADVVGSIPAEMRYTRPSELLRRRMIDGAQVQQSVPLVGSNGKNGSNGNGSNGKAAPQLSTGSNGHVPQHQTFRERKELRK